MPCASAWAASCRRNGSTTWSFTAPAANNEFLMDVIRAAPCSDTPSGPGTAVTSYDWCVAGNGPGGGGGGVAVRARWIRGKVRDSDYPRAAYEAGAGGTVYLRFVIDTNGRVSDCRVTRSSGRADLDAVTCRVIRERFRYRPARNARGQPVPDVMIGQQDWEVFEREPIDERPPPEEREGWY